MCRSARSPARRSEHLLHLEMELLGGRVYGGTLRGHETVCVVFCLGTGYLLTVVWEGCTVKACSDDCLTTDEIAPSSWSRWSPRLPAAV